MTKQCLSPSKSTPCRSEIIEIMDPPSPLFLKIWCTQPPTQSNYGLLSFPGRAWSSAKETRSHLCTDTCLHFHVACLLARFLNSPAAFKVFLLLLLLRSQLHLWDSPFFFFFLCVPTYISGVHHSSSSSAFPGCISAVHHSSSSAFPSHISWVRYSSSSSFSSSSAFPSHISWVHYSSSSFSSVFPSHIYGVHHSSSSSSSAFPSYISGVHHFG